MARPPNYKQDKKRREDAQKRKNAEQQLRKAARKTEQTEQGKADQALAPVKPEGS
jgi:hypothetical protein